MTIPLHNVILFASVIILFYLGTVAPSVQENCFSGGRRVCRLHGISITEFVDYERGEWPSGPASSISLTEVKHGCVRSEIGWTIFQMKDQSSSLSRPSEGTLN